MSEFKPIATQEELDKIIESRLARQKETIEAKFADYDEIKQRNATLETENTAQKATLEETGLSMKSWEQKEADFNAKIAGYETAQMKQKIALQAGIPFDLADRLKGDDEESLKADAERFMGFKAKTTVAPLKSVEPHIPDDNTLKAQNLTNMAKVITHKGE
ncbi:MULTISPECIES: DUF4355 domain-containing protein [unclassified Lactococcus]|uniref:capsid assembly scaffolding protein Gp46 family protein n=1 Tax=unclassified Lactococcus TaxID=2643510 RepID=UPI0011C820C7|nr:MULTISPECIES: DUF4355 domain-containing protein [unclassified Lactococcus]MQW23894.1 DUF4355 domain-containing protein [Lactococcus sp. dk101]TXK37124.1 DUF4355 domain-containing protein [Lactococcus sp. dk310]TXK47979.1 DUF4355 domain-containing protein [Lactococcus sp. dk322]